MPNVLLPLVACTLALSLGCRGCTDAGGAAGSGPAREQQGSLALLRSRVSARGLNRNKVYPKNADGTVACGTDADCFLIQGERCVPAVLMHTDTLSAFGLVETVEARYRIVGSDQGKCKLIRDTTKVSATIDSRWLATLKQRGVSEEEVEQTRSGALETLREGNPGRFACWLTPDQMLEAGVNMAENHYDATFWRLACSAAVAPEPTP